MARKRRTKRKDRFVGDMPTPEQLATGAYDRMFVTEAGTNTKAMAYRSSHDPIKRWERDKKLTDLQVATIERMQTLWHLVYGEQNLCGSYSEPLSAPSGGNGGEVAEMRRLALRDELRGIEGYFDGVRQWYTVFERICRFGMSPVEVCGNRDRALLTVRFIADFIEAKAS